MIVAALGIGIVFALRMWLRDRLRWSGRFADATVLEVVRVESSPWNIPIGGEFASPAVSAWFVRYRFTDSNGVEHEGKSEALPYDPTPALVDGKGFVRFDPRHPERNVWIG
jgi:hypothetical protein